MRAFWKRTGNTSKSQNASAARKPAGQQSFREFLESGMWRSYPQRNKTHKNLDHPRYIAAAQSHEAALDHVDELLSINHAQQNLIELLCSLGEETEDGLWLPK